MFVYLALLTFHPFIPASCGLWGLILVATSRREFTLPQCPTHTFGCKKPSGERVGKLSCLTAEKTYVIEKGTVILLCCASVAPFRMAVNPLSMKKSYQSMAQRFKTHILAQRYIGIIAKPASESNGFWGLF